MFNLPFISGFYFLLLSVIFILGIVIWQRTRYKTSREDNKWILQSSQRIYQILLDDPNFGAVVQKIANTIPVELKFGTGVLAILDEARGTIKRISASQTPGAERAIMLLGQMGIGFSGMEISVNDRYNLMARCLREKKSFVTNDVYDVLGPVVTKEQAKRVQEVMLTKTTFVYPILMHDRPLGVFIASTKKQRNKISEYELEVLANFVNLVGISLQNAKLFTSLTFTTNQLTIANKRLKQLDQLKDDFVSIASHELRTPMTAIRSYAWMALHRAGVPLSKSLEKYLVRVLISTERLINMVNDMLNISRIESGRIEINPEPVDLISLAKDIVDEVYFSKSREKNIQFAILEKPTPKVFADPEKLRQVFLNLVGNSLKFTPAGGRITFDFFSDGKVVEIGVSDTGVGISKDDLSKLFHKFSRLDNSYTAAATSGGTGLGLYISKNLVELMHGRIWATSEGLNKGTTVKVALPVASTETLKNIDRYRVKPKGEGKGLEQVAI